MYSEVKIFYSSVNYILLRYTQPWKSFMYLVLKSVWCIIKVGWTTCCLWKGFIRNGRGLQSWSRRTTKWNTEKQSCDSRQRWTSSVIAVCSFTGFYFFNVVCFSFPFWVTRNIRVVMNDLLFDLVEFISYGNITI